MIKSFKTELDLNHNQRVLCSKHAGTSRYAYNWGLAETQAVLDHNKDNPNDKKKFPSAIDLKKRFVKEIKENNDWTYEVSKDVPQEALRSLITAWKRCFDKKLKSGPPNFKNKNHDQDSFYLEHKDIEINGKYIKLPKFGWVKSHELLPEIKRGKSGIANVVISLKAGRWYISYKVYNQPSKIKDIEKKPAIAADLGIKTLVTLSDGVTFVTPKEKIKKKKRQLKREQRKLEKKAKGSKNREKQKIKVQKKYQDITNIKKDNIHKITTYMAKNHSQVFIEDLNVKGMMQNHNLAASLAEAGFGEMNRQLKYKCEWYGSELIIISRWFPSSKMCSKCLNINKDLQLSDRIYKCINCGIEIDRDLNAAINILNYNNLIKNKGLWYWKDLVALPLLSAACGEVMSVEDDINRRVASLKPQNPKASEKPFRKESEINKLIVLDFV